MTLMAGVLSIVYLIWEKLFVKSSTACPPSSIRSVVDPSSSAWWQIPHHWGLTPYRVEFAHVIPRSSQLLVSLRSSLRASRHCPGTWVPGSSAPSGIRVSRSRCRAGCISARRSCAPLKGFLIMRFVFHDLLSALLLLSQARWIRSLSPK